MKKHGLLISIIIFIVVAIFALYLVLNKGHIGKTALVYTEPVQERDLKAELEKKYISSTDSEEIGITLYDEGEEVSGEYTLVSSNEDIAKIVDNKIKAVSDGKATITVYYDGSETSVDVRVITPIKSMTFTTTNSNIKVGKDLQLKLKTVPSGASLDSLIYTSSNEEIATVNANGIVTGVSVGSVQITITDEYTGVEKTVNLNIKK